MQVQTTHGVNDKVKSPKGTISELTDGKSRGQPRDATLLYPHVVGIVHRLISRTNPDEPAVRRMDASVFLEKYLGAYGGSLDSKGLIHALAEDLELSEGEEEAEALINLSRYRERRKELGQVSWRSFVLVYPKLRASGFSDLLALDDLLEI